MQLFAMRAVAALALGGLVAACEPYPNSELGIVNRVQDLERRTDRMDRIGTENDAHNVKVFERMLAENEARSDEKYNRLLKHLGLVERVIPALPAVPSKTVLVPDQSYLRLEEVDPCVR